MSRDALDALIDQALESFRDEVEPRLVEYLAAAALTGAQVARTRLDALRTAAGFDPNQERDEHGRWTDGDAAVDERPTVGPGNWKNAEEAITQANAAHHEHAQAKKAIDFVKDSYRLRHITEETYKQRLELAEERLILATERSIALDAEANRYVFESLKRRPNEPVNTFEVKTHGFPTTDEYGVTNFAPPMNAALSDTALGAASKFFDVNRSGIAVPAITVKPLFGSNVVLGLADKKASEIRLHPDANQGTMWHEIGHHLEFNSPLLRLEAQQMRVRNENVLKKADMYYGEHMWQLGDAHKVHADPPVNDVARAKRFVESYSHRLYPNGDTEVISTGLQKFMTNPVRFSRMDRPHYDLIYSMLRGKYATRPNK